MQKSIVLASLAVAVLLGVNTPRAHAAPCLTVTVTGSQGGPQAYQG